MKIPFNESIQLTKQERRGFLGITVVAGLVIAILTQTLLSSFSTYISNPGWSEIYDNISTIGIILVVLLYCRLVEKRTPESLGFIKKNAGKNYLIGIMIGFLFISSVFIINLLTNSITVTFDFSSIQWWYIIFSFIGFMFQGLMEETVCRGFIMNSIASKRGVLAGMIINSIIFALLHSFNSGFTIFAGINLFLVGILFSTLFYYTSSIFLVAAVHTAWNFTVGPIFGVEISGTPIYSPIITTVGNKAHSLLNGGDFGFEGGLSVTLVTLILFAIVLYFIKNKKWEDVLNGSTHRR